MQDTRDGDGDTRYFLREGRGGLYLSALSRSSHRALHLNHLFSPAVAAAAAALTEMA